MATSFTDYAILEKVMHDCISHLGCTTMKIESIPVFIKGKDTCHSVQAFQHMNVDIKVC